MEFDFRKVLFASSLIIAAGIALDILYLIIQLLSMMTTGPNGEIIDMVNTGYSILLYPIFVLVYFWAGMRAVNKYSFDAVGAGLVSAFAYGVAYVVQLGLISLLGAVAISRGVGEASLGSPEFVIASAIFGDMAGIKGMGLSAICGGGVLLFGAMINFVIGGFGGLFALRKVPSD